MKDLESIYKEIEPYIYGHENAKTISYLYQIVGLNKRWLRRFVEEVNSEGNHLIINLQDGKGYFVPKEDEMELVNHYFRQELKRLMALKKKLDGVRRYCTNLNQVTLEEWLNE